MTAPATMAAKKWLASSPSVARFFDSLGIGETTATGLRRAFLAAAMEHEQSHGHGAKDGCAQCLVDPKRNRSSLIAWIVAAVAVTFAIVVFVSRSGSPASSIGGYGSLGLLAILACPIMMGAMMLMMRGKH